jgi:phosphomecalonate degydratase large subunit
MQLTREEETILNGEQGWANQTCMKILARLGELFGAEKLIPITSAHVSGISYKTLGDAPIEYLKAMADANAKVKVKTTLNPQSLDSEYLIRKVPVELRNKQLDILKQFDKMGLTESLTCTPYYLGKLKRGLHLAWAESSAVVYANSVLGAWTNREGGPSALAAAVIGKTPDYGIHRPENRQPDCIVNVKTDLRDETQYGVLGIHLGKLLRDKIPIIQGLQKHNDQLKQLSAAIATTGMTNMFKTGSTTQRRKMETVEIEGNDLKRTLEELNTASNKKPDLIFIGCPHCSCEEMEKTAKLVKGKKVKPGIEFWVCTSCHVKREATGAVRQIEKSGGHVLAGVCTVVSWTEKLGIKTIMTNSAKTAYYAPTLSKAEATLAPIKECLKTALQG